MAIGGVVFRIGTLVESLSVSIFQPTSTHPLRGSERVCQVFIFCSFVYELCSSQQSISLLFRFHDSKLIASVSHLYTTSYPYIIGCAGVYAIHDKFLVFTQEPPKLSLPGLELKLLFLVS